MALVLVAGMGVGEDIRWHLKRSMRRRKREEGVGVGGARGSKGNMLIGV